MLKYILCVCALTASLSAQDSTPAREYNLRTMTPEQVNQAAIGHTRYDFRISPEGGLIDATGQTVNPSDIASYLKSKSLDADAFYFLWLTRASAPTEALAGTFKSLGDYGITKIVVRNDRDVVTIRKSSREPKVGLAKSVDSLNKSGHSTSPKIVEVTQPNG